MPTLRTMHKRRKRKLKRYKRVTFIPWHLCQIWRLPMSKPFIATEAQTLILKKFDDMFRKFK